MKNPAKHVRIYGFRAELIYQGPVRGQEHYVVRRDNGNIQIWVMDPPGLSDGYPRCIVDGSLREARAWWKANALEAPA